MSSAKLIIFTAVIIILAVRGGIQIDYAKEFSPIVNFIITAAYGFATGGLLLVTLLTYIARSPLLSSGIGVSPSLSPLIAQSELVPMMIAYQNVWFALPAILLVIVGLWSRKA